MKVRCHVCQNSFELPLKAADIAAWQDGKLIQEAMPYLSPAERELLISGTCGVCFDAMFKEPEY